MMLDIDPHPLGSTEVGSTLSSAPSAEWPQPNGVFLSHGGKSARLQLTVTPGRVSTRLMWPYFCLSKDDIKRFIGDR